MNKKTVSFLLLILWILPSSLLANPIEGFRFAQNNWELICDNTGTCRAAGYQLKDYSPGDDYDKRSSILLTRLAGANQPIKGEAKIHYEYDNEKIISQDSIIEFWINSLPYGTPKYDNQHNIIKLQAYQVDALLRRAKKEEPDDIYFVIDNDRWTLSTNGLNAVLSKMDEFQKRTNTIGAIIQKGEESENNVLQAQPIPILYSPKIENNNQTLKDYYLKELSTIKERVIFKASTSGLCDYST